MGVRHIFPIEESLQRAEPGLGHREVGRGRAISGLYRKNVLTVAHIEMGWFVKQRALCQWGCSGREQEITECHGRGFCLPQTLSTNCVPGCGQDAKGPKLSQTQLCTQDAPRPWQIQTSNQEMPCSMTCVTIAGTTEHWRKRWDKSERAS